MSFSGKVKEELMEHVSVARHCQLAELAAVFTFCGVYGRQKDGYYTIGFQTENEALIRKGFTLLKKTFNIDSGTCISEELWQCLDEKFGLAEGKVNRVLLKSSCCQRAFLRGAFLSTGSMSDPHKGYHLEFVCPDEEKAELIRELIKGFGLNARTILRKKYYVVYLKEGEQIVDLLNIMEAHVSLMDLENLRIVKEMRNSINRRVNCEAANITRTVNAAARQIEDIELLRDHYGFKKLPDALRQMAQVRLEYPDSPLKELGELLDPPVGKSGVNHRLRKLSELADRIRTQKEEEELL